MSLFLTLHNIGESHKSWLWFRGGLSFFDTFLIWSLVCWQVFLICMLWNSMQVHRANNLGGSPTWSSNHDRRNLWSIASNNFSKIHRYTRIYILILGLNDKMVLGFWPPFKKFISYKIYKVKSTFVYVIIIVPLFMF